MQVDQNFRKMCIYFFVYSFCFLGPIGNLLPIPVEISAFRFFYIILLIGIVFIPLLGIRRQALNRMIIFFLPIVYIIVSSALSFISFEEVAADKNPLIRNALLLALFVFSFYYGTETSLFNNHQKIRLVFLYIFGYFVSLIVGYIMFIGFYLGTFSVETISNYHVLLQFGYGLLRFSPGSYPNEYGIVSSFILSILTLICSNWSVYKNNIFSDTKYKPSLVFIIIFYLLTIIALFLATTRAAYIAYIICLFYILFSKNKIILVLKHICITVLIFSLLFFFIQFYVFDIMTIFSIGYESFANEDSSAYSRFIFWRETYELFLDNFMLGIGFAEASNIHNIYLQLLFELGLIGFMILCISLFIFLLMEYERYKRYGNYNIQTDFLKKIVILLFIHIIWFGFSNHNLNHHLTWFGVYLLLAIIPIGKKSSVS